MCDDNFNDYAADAICKEIGFEGAMYWTSGQFLYAEDDYYQEYRNLPITMDDVNCRGNNWEIDCTFITSHNCGHSEDVQLACEGMWPLRLHLDVVQHVVQTKCFLGIQRV